MVRRTWSQLHVQGASYDIERQNVIVYDSLFMKLMTWQHHVMHTLKKYGLQRHDAQCNVVVKTKRPELELYFEDKDEPWVVYNDHTILQVDGYNCGPIAFLKVMEIYGILPLNSVAEIAIKGMATVPVWWINTRDFFHSMTGTSS